MLGKSSMLWKGIRVVFLRIPTGSYLSVGKEYCVTGTTPRMIAFWSDATVSGTYESRLMLDHQSEFAIVG